MGDKSWWKFDEIDIIQCSYVWCMAAVTGISGMIMICGAGGHKIPNWVIALLEFNFLAKFRKKRIFYKFSHTGSHVAFNFIVDWIGEGYFFESNHYKRVYFLKETTIKYLLWYRNNVFPYPLVIFVVMLLV